MWSCPIKGEPHFVLRRLAATLVAAGRARQVRPGREAGWRRHGSSACALVAGQRRRGGGCWAAAPHISPWSCGHARGGTGSAATGGEWWRSRRRRSSSRGSGRGADSLGGECDAQNAHKTTAFELRAERELFMGTSFHRWSVRACACACVRVCVCARATASRRAEQRLCCARCARCALCTVCARRLLARTHAFRLDPAPARAVTGNCCAACA